MRKVDFEVVKLICDGDILAGSFRSWKQYATEHGVPEADRECGTFMAGAQMILTLLDEEVLDPRVRQEIDDEIDRWSEAHLGGTVS